VVPPAAVGTLLIGDGRLRGTLWGAVRTARGAVPLEMLRLVGAGMHALPLPQPQDPPRRPAVALPPAVSTRWSRTIGALGGAAVWQRLVGLRIAVIGVGRTGSLVATTLARLGIPALTLIDPDRVELHNVGEMEGVTPADVGRAKVDALADALRPYAGQPCAPLQRPVTADTARAACLQADVLIGCVDNDAARLATALYATLYHKVLLDLGTGIHFAGDPADSPPRRRAMGADVRLILPGDGCLLCRGQLTDLPQAVEALAHPRALGSDNQDAWRQQRAGSLRTLNQLAAAVGIQLLQDLVAERVHISTWAHLTVDAAGRLTVQYPPPPPPHDAAPCPLCARAGWGDAGLAWVL
jgi:predicted dinucleotide-binding enzyme